ncbi:cytosine-purine permease [Punctularia strigosozonata HHB-11173 SS5]|uniref:cytosine-purine permease n=1 Tax=Punctularia strigosozonata (strain HHB-11173) TaxID=741275 RepID=UPI0004416E35|nr:cytosine-purine permease [Punctularia strigosozonata HHB-11173 SS5]EIN08700.1 cytosine-purine permease [Punctularia strigosozonata HHB-11173 SS5]
MADSTGIDIEKRPHDAAYGGPESVTNSTFSNRWTRKLLSWGVEARGILPVPVEQRTDRRYSKVFYLWLSWNFNILSFSAGTLGPVVFGLGLRDSCLVILFFNLLCAAPPAYFTTWGPKTGLRQMTQARYSFGYFGVIIPSILNMVNMCGFCILNCILGGQTLSVISGGSLSWTVGIVIIAIVSLFISFCGIQFLIWYERLSWPPILLVYLVALGVSGKHLANPPQAAPATAASILSFASTIAGFVITYSSLSSDYTTYLHHDGPSWIIFWYAYLGFLVPIVTLQCLGAAVANSVSLVPSWEAGYTDGNVGGLIGAMLEPVGGFGKFLLVLMALSTVANVAPTFYSFCLSFQVAAAFTARVPRYVFSIVATAIVLPISIVGQHRFYDTLTNFLSVIGYWSSCFAAVVLVEHLVFRKNDFANYDLTAWNAPRRLPLGIAALGASVLSFALVVPCMNQVWFVGPLGKTAGDVGFEVAFGATAVLYPLLRWIERRFTGR